MTRYALIAALLAVVGLSAALVRTTVTVASLRVENSTLTLQLTGCTAASDNLREDKKSDAEIDNMPDLNAVPDRWLLPDPGSGGVN